MKRHSMDMDWKTIFLSVHTTHSDPYQNLNDNLLKIFIYLFIYLFIFHIFIVVQVQLSPFPSHFPTPQPSPLPTLDLTPFGFVHVSFVDVPENPSPFLLHYPFPPPLWSLSVCSYFQCLWLSFACLFVLLMRFHL